MLIRLWADSQDCGSDGIIGDGLSREGVFNMKWVFAWPHSLISALTLCPPLLLPDSVAEQYACFPFNPPSLVTRMPMTIQRWFTDAHIEPQYFSGTFGIPRYWGWFGSWSCSRQWISGCKYRRKGLQMHQLYMICCIESLAFLKMAYSPLKFESWFSNWILIWSDNSGKRLTFGIDLRRWHPCKIPKYAISHTSLSEPRDMWR
jgi:hypothetical protein